MLSEHLLFHVALFFGCVNAQLSSSTLPGRRYFHSCMVLRLPCGIFTNASIKAVVAGDYIYFDGGEVTTFDSNGNISSLAPGDNFLLLNVISKLTIAVNDTLAIPLAENWNNVTLNLLRTVRASDAPIAVNFQSLWWDAKQNTIYSFGGERSGLPQRANVPTTEESIWGFNLNGSGGGIWEEYVGSTAETTWPQGLVRPTNGFWSSDGDTGYFFGGISNDQKWYPRDIMFSSVMQICKSVSKSRVESAAKCS